MSYKDIELRRQRYYKELSETGNVSSSLSPNWDVMLPCEVYAARVAQAAQAAAAAQKQAEDEAKGPGLGENSVDPWDASHFEDLQ